jgi:hypothetical protein
VEGQSRPFSPFLSLLPPVFAHPLYPQTSLSQQTDRDQFLSTSSSKPSHYGLNVTESDDEDAPTSAAAQRNRLLQSTQTLSGSSARLENSHRLAAENEEIGQSVLNGLVGQRMQLQHANEQLEEADVSVGRAGQTINKMVRLCVAFLLLFPFSPLHLLTLFLPRSAGRQKLVLWLFGIVLAALIILILYFKFR